MDGFLPFSRASFMLDVVALGMLLVIPILTFSIYWVRLKKAYHFHRQVQSIMAGVLLFVVVCFEIEIRLFGWQQYATVSPFYETYLYPFLTFHVIVACITTVFWVLTVYKAVRHFPKQTAPNKHSFKHKKLARMAALSMYLTAITGWIFYWMAFIAT